MEMICDCGKHIGKIIEKDGKFIAKCEHCPRCFITVKGVYEKVGVTDKELQEIQTKGYVDIVVSAKPTLIEQIKEFTFIEYFIIFCIIVLIVSIIAGIIID